MPTSRTTRMTGGRRTAVRTRRWWVAVAAAGLVGACEAENHATPMEVPRGADQLVTGLSTHITAAGRRALRVNGAVAYVFNDSATIWIEQASATAFDARGYVASVLQADSGRLDEATGQLSVWGSVVLQTQNGSRRLETVELAYDPSVDRFRTDSAFTFRESGRETQGTCFESLPDLTDWSSCQ